MKNYSIAIFGSALRDDFDKYSDKDLLIVVKDYKTLKKLKKIYSKSDWSISFYTYSKLEYLSKNGSLFVKHLQNEAKVLIDRNQKLKNILSKFIEKTNYKSDIENSKRYFEILEKIPNNTLGYAWFCDSFYVGFRNYLVFNNAEKNIYEFSFNKLLNILVNDNKINNEDTMILKELRVVKRNYRENILDELPSRDFVLKIILIAKKIGFLKSTEIINTNEFKKIIENNILIKKFNPYQRLRLIEGYYCSANKNIPELKKIISNPQFYALKLKDNDYTMKLINKVKTPHNNMYKSLGNKCLNHI